MRSSTRRLPQGASGFVRLALRLMSDRVVMHHPNPLLSTAQNITSTFPSPPCFRRSVALVVLAE